MCSESFEDQVRNDGVVRVGAEIGERIGEVTPDAVFPPWWLKSACLRKGRKQARKEIDLKV